MFAGEVIFKIGKYLAKFYIWPISLQFAINSILLISGSYVSLTLFVHVMCATCRCWPVAGVRTAAGRTSRNVATPLHRLQAPAAGPTPTAVPSGILIKPAVWPQFTNITGQDSLINDTNALFQQFFDTNKHKHHKTR